MNFQDKELSVVAVGFVNAIGQCLFSHQGKSGETSGFSWSNFWI